MAGPEPLIGGAPSTPPQEDLGFGALACPTCGRKVQAGDDRPAAFPFCSQRCQLRDLGAWFAGRYAIQGRPCDADGDGDGDGGWR